MQDTQPFIPTRPGVIHSRAIMFREVPGAGDNGSPAK